jgi:hypothetical protein
MISVFSDPNSKWHPPRAELNKFDGSAIIEWLENYEFYFDIYNTAYHFKIKTIISYLVIDARKWYRYFKLHNHDPPWVLFKEKLLDIFNADSRDHVERNTYHYFVCL